jgi:hypothetical protein
MPATFKIPETTLQFYREAAKKGERISKYIPFQSIQNAASIAKMASKAVTPLTKKYL